MSSRKWPCLWLREWLPALGGTVPRCVPNKASPHRVLPLPKTEESPKTPEGRVCPSPAQGSGGPSADPRRQAQHDRMLLGSCHTYGLSSVTCPNSSGAT